MEKRMKIEENFAHKIAMTRSQNAALLEELEKVEAVLKDLECKIGMLEETLRAKNADAKVKEDKLMKKAAEFKESMSMLEELIAQELGEEVTWDQRIILLLEQLNTLDCTAN